MSKNKYLLQAPTSITCHHNHHIHQPQSHNADSYSLEYSIHSCPLLLRDDMSQMFEHLSPSEIKSKLLIVPIIQVSDVPLYDLNEESRAAFRSDFVSFARQVVNKIKMRQSSDDTPQQMWTDFVDPASGQPVFSKTCKVSNYDDANLFELVLKYSTETTRDSTSIVYHPAHGVNVFPGVIFTTAPVSVLQQVIDEIASIRPCNCHL